MHRDIRTYSAVPLRVYQGRREGEANRRFSSLHMQTHVYEYVFTIYAVVYVHTHTLVYIRGPEAFRLILAWYEDGSQGVSSVFINLFLWLA